MMSCFFLPKMALSFDLRFFFFLLLIDVKHNSQNYISESKTGQHTCKMTRLEDQLFNACSKITLTEDNIEKKHDVKVHF